MGILLFFVIFCVIVIAHEFGHFIIAKVNGIHVVEFCIGMGPCLLSTTRGGTKYAIRLLPIGGACIFEGEDGLNNALEESDEDEQAQDGKDTQDSIQSTGGDSDKLSSSAVNTIDKRTSQKGEKAAAVNSSMIKETALSSEERSGAFPDAPVWAKIATVAAGPIFNFILAFLFSLFIIGSYGVDLPIIQKVMDGGAAMEAGIQAGDKILSLDGKKVRIYRDISLHSLLNKGEEIAIRYEHDGEIHDIMLKPKYSEQDGRYYMGFQGVGVNAKQGVIGTLKYSTYEVAYWIRTTIKSLELLVQGKVKKDDVSGPVGMAQSVTEIYNQSKPDGAYYVLLNMLNFAILLSANLGVLNLVPFPALDGGRLVFLLVEAVRGKPVPPEKEGVVHLIGMVCLLVLMAFVLFNDFTKIFR